MPHGLRNAFFRRLISKSVQIYNIYFIYASARELFYKKVYFYVQKESSLNPQLSTLNFFYYLCTVIWNNMGFWRKNRIFNFQLSIFNVVFLLCTACTKVNTPRPYGYYRITPPDTTYIPFETYQLSTLNSQLSTYPYNFALSRNAVVQPRLEPGEEYWINLYYPAFDATIHCSYKPVRGNLRELTADALEFVYRNASHASAIPEREYNHPEAHVYGVLFDLEGNTASSCQFFLTDSTRHFFRASVYCNCPPNADSLAPVYNYLRTDVIRLVESFEWK